MLLTYGLRRTRGRFADDFKEADDAKLKQAVSFEGRPVLAAHQD